MMYLLSGVAELHHPNAALSTTYSTGSSSPIIISIIRTSGMHVVGCCFDNKQQTIKTIKPNS